jgi:hypothetical protein
MRTNPDPERDDPLLDAMLQDEAWQAASASFKAEALRTFRTRQRLRRLTRWGGSVAVLAVVLASAVFWIGRPAAPLRQVTMAYAGVPKEPDKPRRLTDAELVAAFPKGSCFIAEVDGQKELVFLDPKLERTYVARSRAGDDGRGPQ